MATGQSVNTSHSLSIVNVNVKPLQKLQTLLMVKRSTHPRIGVMYKRWAMFYRSFAQRRFVEQSRGGGDWPPLKQERLRDRIARQKLEKHNKRVAAGGKGKTRVLKGAAILRDTSTLFMVLNPSTLLPGGIELRNSEGVLVGYGGSAGHISTAGSNTFKTVAEIASYHQTGAGNLPVRKIVVPPDQNTINRMARESRDAMQDIINEVSTL